MEKFPNQLYQKVRQPNVPSHIHQCPSVKPVEGSRYLFDDDVIVMWKKKSKIFDHFDLYLQIYVVWVPVDMIKNKKSLSFSK